MQCMVVDITGVYTVSLDSRVYDLTRRSNMFDCLRRDAFTVALN
jgi:hypothetical protein